VGAKLGILILREEHALREFKHRVLVNVHVFGPKLEELRGSWNRLRNEELNNLYSSVNTSYIILATISSGEWHKQISREMCAGF
jgi:hypothetical protein